RFYIRPPIIRRRFLEVPCRITGASIVKPEYRHPGFCQRNGDTPQASMRAKIFAEKWRTKNYTFILRHTRRWMIYAKLSAIRDAEIKRFHFEFSAFLCCRALIEESAKLREQRSFDSRLSSIEVALGSDFGQGL